MHEAPTRTQRLLGFSEVTSRTGISRSTVWRLEQSKSFPARRQISANRVGWLEHEIDDWVGTRLQVSEGPKTDGSLSAKQLTG
jgi:prophage regulatory protein